MPDSAATASGNGIPWRSMRHALCGALILLAVGCRSEAPGTTPPTEPSALTQAAVDRQREAPLTAREPAKLTVTFVDVGQADAILLQVGELDMLVDAGATSSSALKAALRTVSGPLEYLLVSHPHQDHFGGAAGALELLEVSHVLTNGETRGPPRDSAPMPSWTKFIRAVEAEGCEFGSLKRGQELNFEEEGLGIQVLWSGGHFPDTSSGQDINNDSLVLMVSFGGRRLLLTGDIETEAERALVEQYCPDGPADCEALRADVLKVPHHGSAHFADEFLQAVSPGAAVISAAHNQPKGRHCLPRAATVKALRKHGARVLSTSEEPERSLVLSIAASGVMVWELVSTQVFAWDVAAGKCVGSVL